MPQLPYIDFTPSGAAGTQYKVNTFTLNGTDMTNKYIDLSSAPTDPEKTVLQVIGGDVQEYSVDYSITGNRISWDGLGLDGILASADVVIVQFN